MAMLGDTKEIKIIISADPKGFPVARNQIKSVGKTSKDTSKKIQKQWASVQAQWLKAAAALYTVKKAFDVAFEAAQFQQQRQAFTNLAASHGKNADQMIANLKAMSAETISTAELMKSAGNAMVLGIPADKLSKMMEIARASSRITGQTIQKSFEDIAIGVGRQSRMILDNLGIIVKADAAYEQYASKLNKTAAELTDAEKKQAFMNATLDAGQDIIERINVESVSAAEQMQKFMAMMSDFKIILGDIVLKMGAAFINVFMLIGSEINRLVGTIAALYSRFLGLLSIVPGMGSAFEDASKMVKEFADNQFQASKIGAEYSKVAYDVYTSVGQVEQATIKAIKAEEKSNMTIKEKLKLEKERKKAEDSKIKLIKKWEDEHKKATLSAYKYELLKLNDAYDEFAKVVKDKNKLDEWYNGKQAKLLKQYSDKAKKANDDDVKDAKDTALKKSKIVMDYTDHTVSELLRLQRADRTNTAERQQISNELNTRLRTGNVETTDAFKLGWQQAVEGSGGYRSSAEETAVIARTVYGEMTTLQGNVYDAIVKGGSVMNEVWKSLGNVVQDLGKTAFSKAVTLITEKTVASLAPSIAMGAGASAGWGAGEGGVWGSIKEVGLYLAEAAVAIKLGKELAQRQAFAQGGVIDLGRTGHIGKGRGAGIDDVLIRSYPNLDVYASKDEFVVNPKGTARNRGLLEYINRTNKSVLGFAGGGFFQSMPHIPNTPLSGQELTGGALDGISAINPKQPYSERVKNLTDIMIGGGVLSFLKGWGEGGDQYTGIPSGLKDAAIYTGTTLGAAMTAKSSSYLKQHLSAGGKIGGDGGCGGGCSGCQKKTACFGFGGLISSTLPGADRLPGVKEVSERFDSALGSLPGGDRIMEVMDFAERCANQISNPGSNMSNLVAAYFKAGRAPVIPIAQEMLSKKMDVNLNAKLWDGVAQSIFALSSFKDVLGDCAPDKLPGFRRGLDYVPYDNFPANLHKGERVLTNEENREFSSSRIEGLLEQILFKIDRDIVMDGDKLTSKIIPYIKDKSLTRELEIYGSAIIDETVI